MLMILIKTWPLVAGSSNLTVNILSTGFGYTIVFALPVSTMRWLLITRTCTDDVLLRPDESVTVSWNTYNPVFSPLTVVVTLPEVPIDVVVGPLTCVHW